ncbi:uncharacterized protein HMPREF1541_05394 [Cyphellophora europaea CBS 101466]|uniref:peptidylprolyl isomerase n=1 Tax=Cyphellophora europaea (strain CBS 101466) TaxID=1220924 RepID=W2RRL6_CYPE1|nr:uncharacterized protein HMPREF1541_05394 [Cyphellophora europaea CBS 101466]ETN39171.1 hypothetical protein HMPREF1541_05394 [Cyphellophora europaea CBS 101466]
MSQPVGVYALAIPPGGQPVPAAPLGVPAGFRVTMAAIDPTEPAHREDVDDTTEPFATLKIIRFLGDESDEDDDDDDYEDIDSEEDSDDDMEGLNGGPSDPKKVKLSKKQALLEALAADEDEDEDEDMDDSEDDSVDEEEAQKVLAKLQQSLKADKGKAVALDGEESDDDDDDSDEALEVDEHVICTLNLKNIPQQTLDFTVSDNEQVFFKVIGTHTVNLTGNYVLPPIDPTEHDLEPDSDEELDELDDLDDLVGDSDYESDELDDLEDPRITEVDVDEVEDAKPEPAEKGKNKRPAEDSDDEPALDDMISKSLKKDSAPNAAEPTTNGETKKLSKAEKKRLKKLKNNEGAAADAPAAATESKPTANTTEVNGSKDKKVQFAKNLEQGPTPSPSTSSATAKPTSSSPAAAASTTSVRTVQGITIDDRKVGTGPAAKKGSNLSMRYIGKLESGKVFDSNKSGKPFSFKLGSGEVIKGWDIGLEGLQNGGERRITIPANLAYGKKGAPPDIPPNATLKFDVKCVGVK